MYRVNVITTAVDTLSVGVTVCSSLRVKAKADWKQWCGLQNSIQHFVPKNRQLSPGFQLCHGAHFEELEVLLWQQNGLFHFLKDKPQHKVFQAKLSECHHYMSSLGFDSKARVTADLVCIMWWKISTQKAWSELGLQLKALPAIN